MSLRVVHAEGDAAARGRAIGESLGDLIHRSLAFYRGYLEGQSIRDLERTLAPYWAAAERAFPSKRPRSPQPQPQPGYPHTSSSP